jgi:hypothetical protein
MKRGAGNIERLFFLAINSSISDLTQDACGAVWNGCEISIQFGRKFPSHEPM